jgi:hypothetical protein
MELAAAERQRAKTEQQALAALQQKSLLERERAVADQQSLAAIEEKLALEKKTHADAQACARFEIEQAAITRAREQASRAARLAAEAHMAAENQFLEKSAEQARLQREAAEAAEAKARDAIELARVESARAKADHQALAAIQEKLRAEEIARDEAEHRAIAERAAAELAGQRMEAEIEARTAEELRMAAERRALEAARRQKEYALASARQADTLREQSEGERKAAETLAQDLLERMKSEATAVGEWRGRAAAVLAQSPVPAPRQTLIRRPVAALLGGAAFVAGVAVAATCGLDITGSGVSYTAKMAAADLGAKVAVPVVPEKLQMSYQLNPRASDAALPKAGD